MVTYRERNTTGPTVPINVRISEHAYRRLLAASTVDGVSMAAYVERAVLQAAAATLQGHDADQIIAAVAAVNDKRRQVIDRLAGKEDT